MFIFIIVFINKVLPLGLIVTGDPLSRLYRLTLKFKHGNHENIVWKIKVHKKLKKIIKSLKWFEFGITSTILQEKQDKTGEQPR